RGELHVIQSGNRPQSFGGALQGARRVAAEVRAERDDDGHVPLPTQLHGDVTERHAHWCVRLVEGDLDGLDERPGEHGISNLPGDGLDQVLRGRLECSDDISRDLNVVDGVRQVVTGCGAGQVDVETEVDGQLLPL